MQVPYVKAIDIWMALTLTFVFASLIEFAIVNVVLRKEQQRTLQKQAILAAKRVRNKTTKAKNAF